MLIVCPSCASEYTIDSAKIGAEGRTVRCAACRSTWHVAPEPDVSEAEAPSFDEGDSPSISVEAQNARASSDTPIRASKPPRRRPGLMSRMRGTVGRWTSRVPAPALVAGLCVALVIAAIAGRAKIVHAFPHTARLYALAHLPVNLRGLDFREVRSELVGTGNDALLVVEGEISNVTRETVAIPPIEIALKNAEGQPLYTWTNEPPRQTLEAAETARFRARLASPPAEGRQVFVRFAPAGGGAAVAHGGPSPASH